MEVHSFDNINTLTYHQLSNELKVDESNFGSPKLIWKSTHLENKEGNFESSKISWKSIHLENKEGNFESSMLIWKSKDNLEVHSFGSLFIWKKMKVNLKVQSYVLQQS